MHFRKKNLDNSINKQHGAIAVMSAVFLMTLLGFVGLAIDIGYMMTVRNQLQTAADAAALHGADYLVHLTDPAYPGPAPNFTAAKSKAIETFSSNLKLNTANNVVLAIDGTDPNQIETGYWDMTGNLPGILAPSSTIPGTNQNLVPAIKVSVQMNSIINNPVNTFFIKVLGMLSYNMNATAVAVAPPSPSCIGQGVILPFVMNKCAYDEFWNSTANPPSPYLNPNYFTNGVVTTDNSGYLPGYPIYSKQGKVDTYGPSEESGKPWIFWLTSGYHADNTPGGQCEAGQWSSLNTQDNSTGAVRDIIQNFGQANNIDLCVNSGVNDKVWISNGTMSTLYDNKNQPSIQTCASIPAGQAGSCAYALVPVINDNPINAGAWANIVAFACVHIVKAVGGPDFYISVQMVAENDPTYGQYCVAPNSGGGGAPNYGVIQPPALVNYFGNTY
jgi:hypothetical protein